MTISTIAQQLINLSTDNRFNGEVFTEKRLAGQIAAWFRGNPRDYIVMEIELSDGRYWFRINRFGDGADCYDYTIPETREQSERIMAKLLADNEKRRNTLPA